jgi:hypothetical protein
MAGECDPDLERKPMNDNLNLLNSRIRSNDLQRRAATWRRAHESAPAAATELPRDIVIRAAADGDARALRRLAQLEGRWLTSSSRVLVAEVEGEVQAALPLDGGEPIADPFRSTASLVEMLRLRAAELRVGACPQPRRGLRALLAQLRPA